MRVQIIASPYGSFNIKLPVVVEATEENGLYMVHSSELVRVGGDLTDGGFEYAFLTDEVVTDETPPVEQPCDITNKCCNQFGERDEMQAIINSLQADVIARGARIAELENALQQAVNERNEAWFKLEELRDA